MGVEPIFIELRTNLFETRCVKQSEWEMWWIELLHRRQSQALLNFHNVGSTVILNSRVAKATLTTKQKSECDNSTSPLSI